jgi:hypothetical protein
MAAVRWTLARLDEDLAALGELGAARVLRARVAELRTAIGDGGLRRPVVQPRASDSAWVAEATQAMGWIAEERGLGGSRVLDGMAWDLAVEDVWEAWVDRFVADLAPRCGLVALRRGETARRLNWTTSTSSMRMLIPDSGLHAPGRAVWIDAKYKAHLQLLRRDGWSRLRTAVQDAHRADLHQALAYAALEDVDEIDSILVYPESPTEPRTRPGIATIAAGRRRLRLLLIGLPFGFQTFEQRERALAEWRDVLLSP